MIPTGLRDELKACGLRHCILARSGRNRPVAHNGKPCRKRCRIKDAFARLPVWRGIAKAPPPMQRAVPLRHPA